MECKSCGSGAVTKQGRAFNRPRTHYRYNYRCKGCGKRFTSERIPIGEKQVFEYLSKPVPSQNWPAYTQAQNNEKLMLMDILGELSQVIQFNEERKVGRPKTDLHEMIFCLALKTYSKLSCRRLISDLEIAKNRELISHVPHFTTIMKYFSCLELTPILKELIRLSSLPLKEIEEDFAADSSGFSTSQFGRWFDHRFNKEIERRIYLKSHIMVGVRSNTVTSVEVTPGHSNDSPQFAPLLTSTNQDFDLREVSADRAYSSRKNVQLVDDVGGKAYIPFKKNTRGNSESCLLWAKMFRYFKEHKQEFLERYHKRSNVETSFYMIKQKFGSNLMTKSFTAQQNEILTKILCHNICCLIAEYFAQGLNLNFGNKVYRVMANG